MNLPSYQNGKVNKSDYLSIKLWFEDLDESSTETITIYKRYKNLKEAMFYFFMVETNDENSNLQQFLDECQKEKEAESEEKESEEKVVSEGEGGDKKPGEPTITVSDHDAIDSKNETSDTADASENVTTSEDTSQNKNEDVVTDNNNNNENNGENSSSEENADEKPIDKELFDVNSFLMCCCCDPNQIVGIEKAFNVVSEDGTVTAEELFNIYNNGLYIINDNYWHTEKETDIPYPKELFYKIFEELNISPEEKISFNQFIEVAQNNYQFLLTCPFYQLEVYIILN